MNKVGVDIGHRAGGEARKERDVAANSCALCGDWDEAWGSDRDDDDVCSRSVRPVQDFAYKSVPLSVSRDLCTHHACRFEARLTAARHDARAGGSSESAVDESDRSRSQNKYAGVGFDGQSSCCAQAAGEWLGEREVRRGDLASDGGNARERFFGNKDEVGEASIHPRSEQAHVRAHVGAVAGTGRAASAGNLRSESDLRAWSGNVDPCGEVASNAPHACGDFVPEDHTRGDAVRLLSSRNAQVRAA